MPQTLDITLTNSSYIRQVWVPSKEQLVLFLTTLVSRDLGSNPWPPVTWSGHSANGAGKQGVSQVKGNIQYFNFGLVLICSSIHLFHACLGNSQNLMHHCKRPKGQACISSFDYSTKHPWNNWAMSWENLLYAICEQQRRRSACPSAQSHQRICCLLLR